MRRWLAALVGLVALLASSLSAGATVVDRAGFIQHGLDTYFTYDCQSAAQVHQWASTQINQFKSLGANSIGIGFPIYTDSPTSNNVYAKLQCGGGVFWSPPPDVVGEVVQIAHAAGLRVLLRPLIDQQNLFAAGPTYSRNNIEPTNLTTWFRNYTNTIKPYLVMAQADHVEHFALETELDSVADYTNWTAVIKTASSLYKGNLVWDYSWYTGVKKVLRSGTSFAIDAYPQLLGATPSSTTKQLLTMWNALLTKHSYSIPRISLATIDEIGIAAQDGAYLASWKSSFPLSTHPFDVQIQVRWFTAACSFMKKHAMRGIYFWGSWLMANNGGMLTTPNPAKPSNIQPATQTAIKSCFK